jgi:hypothetical protein
MSAFGTFRKLRDVRYESVIGAEAEVTRKSVSSVMPAYGRANGHATRNDARRPPGRELRQPA